MSKTPLLAFHNDPAIKNKYLQRLEQHRAADEIVHGYYWDNGKGCAVGCTVHSGNHAAYETELGIPQLLARLEDGIFESMENGRAKDWPIQFLSAIPVGADLSKVWPQFAVWLLGNPVDGVIRFARTEKQRQAINAVVRAYQLEQPPTEKEWRKLSRSAAAAAWSADAAAAAADAAAAAADAAAWSAADAAWSAAAAAWSAAAAAWSAADADAAWSAADAAAAAVGPVEGRRRAEVARHEARTKQADKLLQLLTVAK